MITFDYAQLNKKGLKDVVKWFEKQALPVAEVRGNNVPKRENGFQIKSAEIEFESGQILIVKAKANVPAFFQVKLNNKVLAIRDYKQLDNELREIAAFVKENEPKYAKNQEKAAAKAKIKVDVPKPVVTTTAEQAEAFKASLAELQGQGEALGNQITEVTAQVNQKTGQLADLQSKLDAEKATTSDLESAIEKAQKGIFESSDPTEAAPVMEGCKKEDDTDDITESATKCEYCGAAMSSNDRRCMKCGKTPEQAHMLAGQRGQVMESALPGFSKWDTFAAGTSAAEGKNSYSIRADGGGGPNGTVMYSVDPISNSTGRHQGYSLKAFGIPGEPGWRWIGANGKLSANGSGGLFSKPQEAVKIAQQIHDQYVENKGGK